MESINRLFSIKDVTAGRFGPLYEAINTEVAVRNFKSVLLKVEEQFRSEYKLYFMGSYDQISGEILQEGPPVEVFVQPDKGEGLTIDQIRTMTKVVKEA